MKVFKKVLLVLLILFAIFILASVGYLIYLFVTVGIPMGIQLFFAFLK